MIFDILLRLEPDPHQRDLARGWAAELADPAWMLGRQWQMGEHQGEDASSPVAVEIRSRATPIGAVAGQPGLDPMTVPAQAIIESEPQDWWTTGRRVRLGQAVAARAHTHGVTLPESVTLTGLPVPYQALNGTGPDGRALWQQRTHARPGRQSWFGQPGPPRDEPVDLWDPAELAYTAELPAGDTTLTITRHDGGDLDWYHADATAPLGPPAAESPIRLTPGRLRYPSAPLPRWWQIEDAQVAIGGQAPDRAALATLVLIDLIVNHSDDWYTFALPARAGQIITLDDVTVIDSFGDTWPVTAPQDWSLFATTGLDPASIVVWATARTPLAGPILDEVVIGIDEDANLVWAVEQIVAGQTLADPHPATRTRSRAGRPGRAADVLLSADDTCPAVLAPLRRRRGVNGRRRFVQGRAADLSGPTATLLPAPVSDLLADPRAPAGRAGAPARTGGDPARRPARAAPRDARPVHHGRAGALDATTPRTAAHPADLRAALRRPPTRSTHTTHLTDQRVARPLLRAKGQRGDDITENPDTHKAAVELYDTSEKWKVARRWSVLGLAFIAR